MSKGVFKTGESIEGEILVTAEISVLRVPLWVVDCPFISTVMEIVGPVNFAVLQVISVVVTDSKVQTLESENVIDMSFPLSILSGKFVPVIVMSWNPLGLRLLILSIVKLERGTSISVSPEKAMYPFSVLTFGVQWRPVTGNDERVQVMVLPDEDAEPQGIVENSMSI